MKNLDPREREQFSGMIKALGTTTRKRRRGESRYKQERREERSHCGGYGDRDKLRKGD